MKVINAYKDDSFNYKIHIYGNFNDVNHKLDDLIKNYSSTSDSHKQVSPR